MAPRVGGFEYTGEDILEALESVKGILSILDDCDRFSSSQEEKLSEELEDFNEIIGTEDIWFIRSEAIYQGAKPSNMHEAPPVEVHVFDKLELFTGEGINELADYLEENDVQSPDQHPATMGMGWEQVASVPAIAYHQDEIVRINYRIKQYRKVLDL